MFDYPYFPPKKETVNVPNGQFEVGKVYICTSINEKAKPGWDGQPRFTVGGVYRCVRNGTATSESVDVPPTFLTDNGFADVNCGSDAKLKSTFALYIP